MRYKSGVIQKFEVASQLSEKIGVTRRTIYNWLKGICDGYEKYGIDTITYI
jgi:transcriptional antiterminator